MEYTVNYDGFLVKFNNLENGIYDRCIRTGIPTEAESLMSLWKHLIKEGDICYDIGGYIGTYSIAFALAGGRVETFEASPKNYNRCISHCKPFNVRVHKVGLLDNEKELNIKFPDCNWDDCGNIPYSQANPIQNIQFVILEEYCQKNNIPWPNFIKMDIEGYETLVLDTFNEDRVLSLRPILYIEKHPDPTNTTKRKNFPNEICYSGSISVENGGFDFNKIRNKWNYSIFILKNGQFNKIDKNIDLNPLNSTIICFPN